MIDAQQIERMSAAEKVLAMEALWASLSADDADVHSPDWHVDALRETEARRAAGEEAVLDWAEAKARLRQSAE